MIFDCRDEPRSVPRGRLYDQDTGEEVTKVFWWDTETGEYERFATDAGGLCYVVPGTNEVATERSRRRLRFVPFNGEPNLPVTAEAP
jgi:hypothetical protein